MLRASVIRTTTKSRLFYWFLLFKIFTTVFALEFVLKLAAFRFKASFCLFFNSSLVVGFVRYHLLLFCFRFLIDFQNYFSDPWNVFDFIIVLGSFIDIVYSGLNVFRASGRLVAKLTNLLFMIHFLPFSRIPTSSRSTFSGSSEWCD